MTSVSVTVDRVCLDPKLLPVIPARTGCPHMQADLGETANAGGPRLWGETSVVWTVPLYCTLMIIKQGLITTFKKHFAILTVKTWK